MNLTEENFRAQVKLPKIFNFFRTFETNEECKTYIQWSVNEKIILIVSGRLGRELVPQIHHLKQIVAIYIYCANMKEHEQWSNIYDKVS